MAALGIGASKEQCREEEEGSGTLFGSLPKLERQWKGRAMAVRNGSAWSSVAALWKPGGGELVAKMDAGWRCEGFDALIYAGDGESSQWAEELRRQ
jgi:hypothetical protein